MAPRDLDTVEMSSISQMHGIYFTPSPIFVFCIHYGVKNFSTRIDDDLSAAVALYAIHLRTTKAEAGALAMRAGIPTWVMSVPPTEARAMALAEEQDRFDDNIEAVTKELFEDPKTGEEANG